MKNSNESKGQSQRVTEAVREHTKREKEVSDVDNIVTKGPTEKTTERYGYGWKKRRRKRNAKDVEQWEMNTGTVEGPQRAKHVRAQMFKPRRKDRASLNGSRPKRRIRSAENEIMRRRGEGRG